MSTPRKGRPIVPRRPIIKVNAVPANADAVEPVAVTPLQPEEELGGPRDTPEAKEFSDFSFVTHKKGDTQQDRRPAGTNMFSMGERTRQRYGIKPEEEVAWPIDTRYGNMQNIRPDDNIQILLDSVPGAELVIDPATKQPVRVGVHVAVKYPRALKEEWQRRIDDAHSDNKRRSAEHQLPGDREMRSEDEMRAWAEENRDRLRGLGVGSEVGSPTAGLPFAHVIRGKSAEEISSEMDRFRQGGRRPNLADLEAAAAEQRERQARNTSGQRKVWSGWRPD